MKNGMRKHLSAPGLMQSVHRCFKKVPDPLQGKTAFSLANCLMSALAVFSLKYPSLLQFDNSQTDEKVRHNLKTLFFIEKAPSDTYMRERLDKINPSYLRWAFKACFSALQRGKMLPLFYFLDDYVLVSNDGTGFFNSKSVQCQNCCTKNHQDGSTSYYHQMLCAVMVSPDQKEVIPLGMEPILNQHGNTKNDCESNASKRLLSTLRKMHPKLKMVIVEDALYANAPHIKHLKKLNYSYIIGVKPKSHAWLFDYVQASKKKTLEVKKDKSTYKLSWVNDVPLNDANSDVRVNFIECIETTAQGNVKKFTWVTSFHVTKNTVFRLMTGGRSRWKIENETFNTLKTQGYHFEHNFGHGYQHLSSIMGNAVMLAFLIDQLQQLCCPTFRKALKKCQQRIRLWHKMREWFLTFYIDSWEAFFTAIFDPPDFRLTLDTS